MLHSRTVLAFVSTLLPILLIIALITPVGEVPDELAHVLRADGLGHGALIGHRGDINGQSIPSAGVMAHEGLFFAASPLDPVTRKVQPGSLFGAESADWGKMIYVHIPNTAVYGPWFYGPAAIALRVCEAVGTSPYVGFRVARVVNSALYVILAGLAVLLAARGRTLLFLILGVPMSLALAGSVNQDGLIIATCALIAALLQRVKGGLPQRWEFWVTAFLLLQVLMARPPYIPLALLLLVTPSGLWTPSRDSSDTIALRHRLIATLVVVSATMAWTLTTMIVVSVPFGRDAYMPGPWAHSETALLATDPAWQAKLLLSVPSRLFTMPWDTFIAEQYNWLTHMVGVLGPLAHIFSPEFYVFWPIVAGSILLLGGTVPKVPRTLSWSAVADRIFAPLLVLVTVWLIIIAQYLSWTPVGNTLATGVQGRYFLPLLPFLTLILAQSPRPHPGTRQRLSEIAGLMLVVGGAVCAVLLLVNGYYLD